MNGWYRPQVCDSEGVPALVQRIRFTLNMSVVVEFFNGSHKELGIDWLCPSVGILQRSLTRMQELECINNIEKLALSNPEVFQ